MEIPKISVIVPIYNAEEYLEESLNCLLNQTFIDNMEILMIDRGSTDHSRKIIRKYAVNFDNYHEILNENKELSKTKNFALDYTNGEYIHFFKCDDYIDPQGYERLYKLGKRNDSDIVTSFAVRLRRYNISDSLYFQKGYENIYEDLDCIRIKDYPELLWDITLGNKIYKKEFIEKNNLRFNEENISYSDGPFALKAYTLTDRISVSKETFYYWRISEKDNLPIGEKSYKLKNFKDRLKNLSISKEILDQSDFDEKTKEELYFKWLYHDLNAFYRNFHKYNENAYGQLVEKTKEIISIIPEHLMDRLNSFQRVIYKMVDEEDIEGLYNFSPYYTELMDNPHIPETLDERYIKYIDFIKDANDEELIVKKEKISYDKKNIYIEFSEKIKYMGNYPHKNHATLVDRDNNEYSLKLNEKNQIIVPIKLILNKRYSKIKIEYECDKFKKSNFLKNPIRENLKLKNFDIQIGIGKNKHLLIDLRETDDTVVEINEINFKNRTFLFYGNSNNQIDNIYIENLLNFNRHEYAVISNKKEKEGYSINFEIPYDDILNQAVKKWEILCQNKFKTIKLTKKFEFYSGNSKILFKNARNKILIEDDVFKNTKKEIETLEEIKVLKEKIALTRSFCKEEKAMVANIWHLVEMTKMQLELKRYFDENIDDLLKYDLEDEEELLNLFEELKPSISALRRYSEYGMTFSISPEVDALIKEVMLRKGQEKLIEKIELISEKEYFIE